jgi:hypothetical protein
MSDFNESSNVGQTPPEALTTGETPPEARTEGVEPTPPVRKDEPGSPLEQFSITSSTTVDIPPPTQLVGAVDVPREGEVQCPVCQYRFSPEKDAVQEDA